MEFRILGALEVVGAGGPLGLGSAQQRAALALLVVAAPEPMSRDRMVDELWGERPPASAAHAVQVYVSGIRKVLRAGGGESVVVSHRSGYELAVADEQVDARRFERLAGEARAVLEEDPGRARELFGEALSLWRGPALADLVQFEFAAREAARLAELRSTTVEGMIEARLARGEHAEVIAPLNELVAENPLRERPNRLLMLALYRAGRHAEALDAYRNACRALDEIGLQPSPELRDLEQAILRHDEVLRPTAAAAPASGGGGADREDDARLAEAESGLPAARDPLIGRSPELELIARLLTERRARLVSLLGPGGAGKTRLGLAAAEQLESRYRDGVRVVFLAELNDAGLVGPEIARATGVPEVKGEPLERALAAGLADREMLIVLDNFEHVLAAGELIARLLDQVPSLTVLTTSREPLRVAGEQRVAVEPLAPAAAAELFQRLVIAIRPELGDRADDDSAIERICAALDRLPLALEIAAANASLFSLDALADRVEQRVELAGGRAGAPDRHRTLKATIDWSYGLLSSTEQRVFIALSCFRGGARLAAIEAVVDEPAAEVIAVARSLVEKHLLYRVEDPDGQPRLFMLATIREYAAALASAEQSAADRHAGWFVGFAETASRGLEGPDQVEWLERIDRELDNLRAAFAHSAAHRPQSAVRLAAALGYFWDIRGHFAEAGDRLAQAHRLATEGSGAAALVACFLGRLRFLEGDLDAGDALLQQAELAARNAGDARAEVWALTQRSFTEKAKGNATISVEVSEQAVSRAREADDEWAIRFSLNRLGDALATVGRLEEGRVPFSEALVLAHAREDSLAIAGIAGNLADLELTAGELETAAPLILECLAHGRRVGYRTAIGAALGLRALLSLHRGEIDEAAGWVTSGVEEVSDSRQPMAELTVLGAAALLKAAQADAAAAALLWAAFDRGLSCLFSVADMGGVRRLCDAWLPAQRAAIGPTAWEAACAEGARLTPRQAVARFRSDLASTGEAQRPS